MSLEALVGGNTQRARATAVKAFERFLASEGERLKFVKDCNLHDESEQCFVSTVDKFGMYLEFHEGKAGKPLARHSCMQNYCQAKHWFLIRSLSTALHSRASSSTWDAPWRAFA